MAYQLRYSSGTQTLTVEDNTANTQTLLVLPGRDFVGYGSPVDQNMLSMIENFASYNRASVDQKAIRGQLWFDITDNTLKYNISSSPGIPNWFTLATSNDISVTTATTTTLGSIKVGSGLAITADGTLRAIGDGSGTVTSVGLSMPSGFTVSGSPITSSGTLAISTTLNGIIAGNGSGFSTVNIGSGLSYSGGTLSATGGGGGGTAGVSQILAGAGIKISPTSGTGTVTVTATTYSISALDSGGTGDGASIRLIDSNNVADSVLLQAGANIVIDATNDNTIVIAATGGGGGGGGFQSSQIIIYKWAETQPTAPAGSSQYTWATGALSSVPADWNINPPSTSPTPGWSLWALRVYITAASDATATPFSWSSGSIYQVSAPGTPGAPGAPGATGTTGTIYNTAYLYQWAPALPTAPNGTSTWTWASGAHTGYTGGNNWSVSLPANPGTAGIQLWTAAKAISAPGGTTSTSIDWTDGTVTISAIGQNGAEGPAGVKTGVAAVYQWSLPPAPSISGTSTFDWSAGAVTSAPSGWFVSSTTAPAAGYYLYEARVNLTAASTATTTTVNWSSALISIAGYAGTNGGGGDGAPTTILAYARIANNPQPVSGTYQTNGISSLPSNTATWGTSFNTTWYTSDPNPSSNDSLYVCSGIYDPATDKITWTTPYLASLRVGNLSAITANTGDLSVTGSITAGNSPNLPAISGTTMTGTGAIIYSTGNFAMGNSTTNIAFNGTQLTLNGNVVNTANIANNAVTIPLTYESSTFYSTGGVVLTYNFNIPTAGTKLIVLWQGQTISARWFYFRIYLNSIPGPGGGTAGYYDVGAGNGDYNYECTGSTGPEDPGICEYVYVGPGAGSYIYDPGTPDIGNTRTGGAFEDAPTAIGLGTAIAGTNTIRIYWERDAGDLAYQRLIVLGAQR